MVGWLCSKLMVDFDALAVAARSDPAAADQLFEAVLLHLQHGWRHGNRQQAGADGDDIVQNTLLAVHRRLHKFESRGPGSFLRWVHGVARLESKELLRRSQRSVRLVEAVAREARTPATNLSSRIERQQQLALVHAGVTSLVPAHQRAIASDLGGGDTRLLAAREQITVIAARALRCRARRRLRDLVAELAQVGLHPQPSTPSPAV